MYQDFKVYSKKNSTLINFDLRKYIDSVISIEIKERQFDITIETEYESEDALDLGFPLYLKDGKPSILDSITCEVGFFTIKKEIMSFFYLQTAFIKVCTESNRAIQMLKSNPCLLWLMLDHSNKYNLSINEIHHWLGVKRKKITSKIFKKNILGDEKFLSKIILLTGEQNELELIKRAILIPGIISAHKHWSNIPIQALYLLERYPTLYGADFLLDWCSKKNDRMSSYLSGTPALKKITEDTIRMGKELNIKSSRDLVMACKTINQLNCLHDKWIELLNKARTYYNPDIFFKKPKIEDGKGIEWIATANLLIDEGKYMQHCIATYVKKVIRGDAVIYSIYYPERATLEVSNKHGEYSIIEIKKINNINVSSETLKHIGDWLRDENEKLNSKRANSHKF